MKSNFGFVGLGVMLIWILVLMGYRGGGFRLVGVWCMGACSAVIGWFVVLHGCMCDWLGWFIQGNLYTGGRCTTACAVVNQL